MVRKLLPTRTYSKPKSDLLNDRRALLFVLLPCPFRTTGQRRNPANPGLGWFPLLDFRTLSGPQVLGHPAFPHGTRIPLRGFCGWKRFSRQPERVSPCESRPLRPGTTNHPLTRAQVITVFIQRGVPSQLLVWKVDRQWNPTATGFQRSFRVTPATRHTPLIRMRSPHIKEVLHRDGKWDG